MTIVVRLTASLLLCAGIACAGAASADPADTAKKPTKAELGAMLKKCSDEADAKGLTVQMGRGAQRKAYRRSCMEKNGVKPRNGT